VQIA